jgi:hypothetical protein
MIIYLYVKTHNKTGLKYLGKTTMPDPHAYTGSGVDWKKHLKEHGEDYTTEIIRECRTNQELNKWGRYYSELWNIVESPEWANRIPETGGGSCGPEAAKKISETLKGRKKPLRSDSHKENLSKSTKGKAKPRSVDHQNALTDAIKLNWKLNDDRRSKTAAVGKANLGRKHSPKTLEKKRQAMLRYWEQKQAQVV